MEGDRAAVLTLRSAARGVVDYSEVDIHDGAWWQRWRYLLKAMENEDYAKLLDLAFNFQLALVSNSKLDNDNFKKVQKEAKEVFRDIEGEMRPWLGLKTREERQKAETDLYDEIWQRHAGFSMRDAEAVAEWNSKIADHIANDDIQAEEERKKSELSSEEFERRVAAIQRKRREQQGR